MNAVQQEKAIRLTTRTVEELSINDHRVNPQAQLVVAFDTEGNDRVVKNNLGVKVRFS